jgi:hypothetical protein
MIIFFNGGAAQSVTHTHARCSNRKTVAKKHVYSSLGAEIVFHTTPMLDVV